MTHPNLAYCSSFGVGVGGGGKIRITDDLPLYHVRVNPQYCGIRRYVASEIEGAIGSEGNTTR